MLTFAIRLHLFVFLTFLPFLSYSQSILFPEPLSPRIANYDIDVKLNPEESMLYGREVLSWTNKSADVISELQFHLYLNAFRNNRSTYMQETGRLYRSNIGGEKGWGYIEIGKMSLLSGAEEVKGLDILKLPGDDLSNHFRLLDLTEQIQFIQPDDGNEHDRTVIRVPLPQALSPGQSIKLYIDFTAKLPEPPFERSGRKKEYFLVGQWFPKIGVYGEDGWNTHQFHANSEFFADFGNYNVFITVPEKNIVGATGIAAEITNNEDSTTTHFYHAEDVHDFAWTTSPDFIEFKGTAQDVNIRVLMQKDRAYQGPRHLEAAKVAIKYYQNWYGDYPFPNLTIVDPRRRASGSAGMEYPTFFTAGTMYGLPDGIHLVEDVIVHEFGHNYFYHMLASNEFEESWLDEGITTYTQTQIMNDAYGPQGDFIDFFGVRLNNLQYQRAEYVFWPDLDQTIRKAWEYYSRGSYGVNSYSKPTILLATLQNYLGKEIMFEIMRTYVKRWRFKHPKTQDFIDIAHEVSGQNLNRFFQQVLYSNAILDYAISSVISREMKPEKGYGFTISTDEEVEMAISIGDSLVMNNPDTTLSDSQALEGIQEEEAMYYSQIKVRRLGDFIFPVEILISFEGGEEVCEVWDGEELWKKYVYIKPVKLISASVDPERKILLDVNFTNNSRTVETQRLGLLKLSARLLFGMQLLMEQPELLALLSGFTGF
jgi:hypothetical protein